MILFVYLKTSKYINMGTKTKEVKKARSAKSGRYVTIDYAEKHPDTTVIETDKIKVKRKSK